MILYSFEYGKHLFKLLTIVYMFHNLINQFPVLGYIGCFQFFLMKNNIAINK